MRDPLLLQPLGEDRPLVDGLQDPAGAELGSHRGPVLGDVHIRQRMMDQCPGCVAERLTVGVGEPAPVEDVVRLGRVLSQGQQRPLVVPVAGDEPTAVLRDTARVGHPHLTRRGLGSGKSDSGRRHASYPFRSNWSIMAFSVSVTSFNASVHSVSVKSGAALNPHSRR